MPEFDLKRDELLLFFGLVIAFGVRPSAALVDHFSLCPLLGSPFIVRNMPYRRFREILSCLHFADNESLETNRQSDDYDILGKIRPLLTMMSTRFRQLYWPHHNVSIDEAMVAFKGRISIRQYMPIKPTKYGIKVWSM